MHAARRRRSAWWVPLVAGLGVGCLGPEPLTVESLLGLEAQMTLGSNKADTVFRVREQGVGLGPEEGWREVGRGESVTVALAPNRRWEIAASAPGYQELRVRLTEPLPRWDFRFLGAHRRADAAPAARPAPAASGRAQPPPPEELAAVPELTGPGGTPLDPAALRGVDFGRYHALVIGNDAYRDLPALRTAEADAEAMAAVLRDRYGFQVRVLKNATRSDVIAAFEEARRRLTERDNLLIYYAGHGYFDRDTERGYWLPVDAAEHTRANWISNADITDSLRSLLAKHVLVVADSCYSGTLTRGVSMKLRGSDYVRRMAGKRARVVLTSGGLEPVEDGGGSGHSVFARALLETLRSNEGLLDGTSLFARIRRPVVLNSPQTPEYGDIRFTGHEGGDFLFVPRP